MSWIYGFLHKEQEHAPATALRETLAEYHSPALDIFAGGHRQTLQSFDYPGKKGVKVFVMGNPILRSGDDYRYPAAEDWTDLLASEAKLQAMDGHWLLLIANRQGVVAYNDSLCKRSLYIHEDESRIFFTSDLELLRQVCRPSLDMHLFGAYWHSIFPPLVATSSFAPTHKSCYKDVQMLGTGGKAEITRSGLKMSLKLWNPNTQPMDLEQRVANMTLLPFRAGRKVTIGLSGGMDIRPLLAIILGAKQQVSAVHTGSDRISDYRVAASIAKHLRIPFRFLSPEDYGGGWDQACQYLVRRGLGFNPANNDSEGYYPIINKDCDVFMTGYFGELYRFRFLPAYLASTVKSRRMNYHALARIFYRDPPSFFVPDARRQMQQGYWSELKENAALMPPSKDMPNTMWLHLFLLRYGLRRIIMPGMSWLDTLLVDHMPWLQSSIISGHWSYGFVRQLNEGLHRRLVKRHCPALEVFPISLGDVSAPYSTRQIPMKIKTWLHYKGKPLLDLNRNSIFMRENKAHILELRQDSATRDDPAIDQKRLDEIINGFYNGDNSQANALLSYLSYALGK